MKQKPKLIHNLVVVEISGLERRSPSKPHLYVLRTQRSPKKVIEVLNDGGGPEWTKGHTATLRPDLVPNFKPTKKIEVAEARLKNLKVDLTKQGFAINGDSSTWRVYVLNVDADADPPIIDRGKLGKVVYVGQTSSQIDARLRQHQGEKSKSGRFIGSRKLKGRNPTLNGRLTPSRVFYTELDAIEFETLTHKKLEKLGYRVLGDVQTEPKSGSRNVAKS